MSDDESDEDDEVMQPAMQVCTKVRGFRRLRTTKEDQFYRLDWTDVPKDIIEALFPIQEGRYGRLDHPPTYLKSTALVEQWRMIGGNEQQNVIDRLEEEEEIERRAQATSSAREMRSNRRSVGDDIEDDVQVKRRRFSDCPGITKATINESGIVDKDEVLAGYAHVVGNVLRSTAHHVSNNNAEWAFGHDIAGHLLIHNGKDGVPHNWVCKRVEEDEKMVRFSFAHRACIGVVESGTGLCAACMSNKYTFFRTCRVEADKHEKSLNDPTFAGPTYLLKFASTTILLRGIEDQKKTIHALRTKLWKKEKAIRLLHEQDIVASNLDHDLLFDEKILSEAYEMLKNRGEVKDIEMMDILFQECKVVKRRMEVQGNAKGHTYTPLMIRFAIMLRRKVSKDNYEFMRQVFGLPTNATLCQYRNADTTAEDGIMHETCIQQAQWLKSMHIPMGDFRTFVALCFDSHTIRQKIGEYSICSS